MLPCSEELVNEWLGWIIVVEDVEMMQLELTVLLYHFSCLQLAELGITQIQQQDLGIYNVMWDKFNFLI